MTETAEALTRLGANIERVRTRIAEAARASGRDPRDVMLLAVTKYVDPDRVRLLHRAGLRDFGESTVQGAAAKRASLGDLEGARWHLIGHLQRNKVARALPEFQTIHSLDSVRLAREIAARAQSRSLPLPGLYVELNLSGDPAKTGAAPGDLAEILAACREGGLLPPPAPGRGVIGLMAMAPHLDDAEGARPFFRRLRTLRDAAVREGALPPDAGLSMGMSGDFEVAVEEGATVVRIGSALFEGLGEGA